MDFTIPSFHRKTRNGCLAIEFSFQITDLDLRLSILLRYRNLSTLAVNGRIVTPITNSGGLVSERFD